MAYRIILADDHQLVRESCRALIEAHPGFEVVADVGDGKAAIEAARVHQPDLVIMDITMPGMNGVEATQKMTAETPSLQIICLSMHVNPRFVSAMLSAGVKGYVLKTCAAVELIEAMTEVLAGRSYVSPNLRSLLPPGGGTVQHEALTAFTALSTREREVLQLIADGFNTHEIAAKLRLSKKTVATHRERIMGKLKTQSVAKLTKYAIQQGLSAV